MFVERRCAIIAPQRTKTYPSFHPKTVFDSIFRALELKTTFSNSNLKRRAIETGTTIAITSVENSLHSTLSLQGKMMFRFKFGIPVLGIALGLFMFAAPSSAEAQCGYSGGYSSYYAPSYGYGNYYAPSYGYSNNYYAPSYGYYGGGGYYNPRVQRVRRAVSLAVVAGAVIAISNNSSRNRSRSRRRY